MRHLVAVLLVSACLPEEQTPECLAGGQVAVAQLCAADPTRALCFLPCATSTCAAPTAIAGCTLPFSAGQPEATCVEACP